MLKAFRKGMEDDRGFTLIELMVVVLIIAILIAIAIPTFLGMRRRAQDRAAQSDLRNGLTAAKAFYTDDNTYAGFTSGGAGTAEAIEPSLTWLASGADPDQRPEVTIETASATVVYLIGGSASTTYFCIRDDVTTGTTYGEGTLAAVQAACAAASW